jgi:hypothetical protein
MTLGIKKAVSSRTMRVATAFTGAATCAVAFTPTAAQAATIRPANTRMGNCLSGNQSTWLHIITADHSIFCLGGRGIYSLHGAQQSVSSFCGGNNSGHLISFYSEYAGPFEIPFYAGTYYNQYGKNNFGPYHAFEVSISKWHGGDECAYTAG